MMTRDTDQMVTTTRIAAARLRWRVFAILFRALRYLSDGIALGFREGFDSGPMLDYVYENRAHGRAVLGKLVDRAYLDAIGWRAVRARKRLLTDVILELLNGEGGQSAVILDIASGPGRYLLDVCASLRARARLDRVEVIGRDLDPVGLDRGRRRATDLGLTNLRFEVGDACDPADLASARPPPDLVIASGLYELLDPPLIRRSMAAVFQILPPGGRFVFTTQVRHPQLELIANLLTNRRGEPWVMMCHPLEEAERWAREAGFRVVRSQLEEVGLFGVTVCCRDPFRDVVAKGDVGAEPVERDLSPAPFP